MAKNLGWGNTQRSNTIAVNNSGVASITAAVGAQVWYSFAVLKQSGDADSFANILHKWQNSNNSLSNPGPATGKSVVDPFAVASLTSWNGGQLKVLRECTELYFTNEQNTNAHINIFLLRARHPVQSAPLLYCNGNNGALHVYDNSLGINATSLPLDFGNTNIDDNIFNFKHLWKWWELIEQRKLKIKPGFHKTTTFHLENYISDACWKTNAADNYNATALIAPGEYYIVMQMSGGLYPDANYNLGNPATVVRMMWRNSIIWQIPRPFLFPPMRYDFAADILTNVAAKFKYVPESDTDLASAVAKVGVGTWQ